MALADLDLKEEENTNCFLEFLGIISGVDELLVGVLAKVGMERDDGVVLVILSLQENTSRSISGFGKLGVF